MVIQRVINTITDDNQIYSIVSQNIISHKHLVEYMKQFHKEHLEDYLKSYINLKKSESLHRTGLSLYFGLFK